jgi:NitT/TauT family transport system substrate-binding protein
MLRPIRWLLLIAVLALVAACAPGEDAVDPITGEPADGEVGDAPVEDGEVDPGDPADQDDQAEAAGESQHVRFGVATASQIVSLSPYTAVPEAMGYFAEEGLDVEVLGFAGGGPTVEALDANQLDIAIPPVTSLFAARNAGSDIISFYTQITGNYLIPMVPEDSDITEPLDLEGRTVGAQSLASANIPLIRAMIAQEGGNPENVEFVGTGGPSEAASFLEQGHIDVLALWDAAYAQIQSNTGIQLRPIGNDWLRDLGFHQSLIAHETLLAENRDMLVGMGRAISKGMVFADENPEAAIRIYWDAFPDSRPADLSEEEAMEQALLVLEARAANTQPVDGVWGLSTEEQVREHLEAIVEQEGYADIAVSDVWTDELLDEINDFDEEAVREEARSWQG